MLIAYLLFGAFFVMLFAGVFELIAQRAQFFWIDFGI